MNISHPLLAPSKFLHRIFIKSRRLLPGQKCQTLGRWEPGSPRISKIYIINLDRQRDRWNEIKEELRHVRDASGADLAHLTTRFPAVDARTFGQFLATSDEVTPFYTLGDQLFVEPQPRALPDRLELERPIEMSRPEIAVACSHIGVWRQIAAEDDEYALVLEDDVWFRFDFARHLDDAWVEIRSSEDHLAHLDVLYLSYKEVRHGAQKTFLSRNVFRPVRGLWYLSGYVLSRRGAAKLLELLPCRGPVDLWINHKFAELNVRATRKSIIAQRRDGASTNSYSILPSLTRIGVIDSEGASLFQIRPTEQPVFAFGSDGSGLSSLAMALSMLGYRCCSDLQDLPEDESERLFSGRPGRVFDAYVNVGSLEEKVRELRSLYLQAKFIFTAAETGPVVEERLSEILGGDRSDVAVLRFDEANKWRVLCEHVRCAPPVCSFPEIEDLGQRRLLPLSLESNPVAARKSPRRDKSPWVVPARQGWRGIHAGSPPSGRLPIGSHVAIEDCLEALDTEHWFLRDDTFAGNQALFRPENAEFRPGSGAKLRVRKQNLGVRDYSAAAISSCSRYLFGRFEAVIRAASASGVVTGFFLHRDSPRQEIDVEIVGNRPSRLLVNVFFNPGCEGARFDYGYRGAPSHVELGFDASTSAHRFAIEWEPSEIRWLVDDQLVHRRVGWDPTPIPYLPMSLHVNTWPSRSRELAGRVSDAHLPATTVVKSITVDAMVVAS